ECGTPGWGANDDASAVDGSGVERAPATNDRYGTFPNDPPEDRLFNTTRAVLPGVVDEQITVAGYVPKAGARAPEIRYSREARLRLYGAVVEAQRVFKGEVADDVASDREVGNAAIGTPGVSSLARAHVPDLH